MGEVFRVMEFRAFGVVPAKMTNDSDVELKNTAASYRKVLSHEGQGYSAFAAIAEGLRACARGIIKDTSFEEFRLQNKVSSVASVLSVQTSSAPQQYIFVKSYDYRIRTDILQPNRCHANIDLVRRFVDKEAQHHRMANLEVVVTKFYSLPLGATTWYSDFPVSNLQNIVRVVAELHGHGYVHGDIRLFNFLLHKGKVVDFDHARSIESY